MKQMCFLPSVLSCLSIGSGHTCKLNADVTGFVLLKSCFAGEICG
jgi:hypothetical protein